MSTRCFYFVGETVSAMMQGLVELLKRSRTRAVVGGQTNSDARF
jgi:hypothetical protein